MKNQGLNRALSILNIGNQDFANLMGITRAAFHAWNRIGVPVKYCKLIEKLTNGAVDRRELRPDDWQKYWD